MLYSRAGDYPKGQALLYEESFSPNTAEGCPPAHGLGRVPCRITERSMVPDDSLSIRERAVAAWPTAWHGQNLRDILTSLGHDVDTPWRALPRQLRELDPVRRRAARGTAVYAGLTPQETRAALKAKLPPSYMGTFTGARKYVLQTFASSPSAQMKKRVARYMLGADCSLCHGKRLRPGSLSVRFAGRDIADVCRA